MLGLLPTSVLGPLYHAISFCLPDVINVQLKYNEKPQRHSKPPWRFLLIYLHLPCVAFAFELTHLSTLRPSQRVTLLESLAKASPMDLNCEQNRSIDVARPSLSTWFSDEATGKKLQE